MIQNTFQILERVSERREKSIWKQGIRTWDDFLGTACVKGIPKEKKPYFDRQLEKAKKHLHLHDSSYFTNLLPSVQAWRLYGNFRQDAVFLDIETEGVCQHADIVVFGLYDGIRTKTMIRGINFDPHALKQELQKYSLIITFNGSSFDLPFIRRRYDFLPGIPHIDIRHCCARLGMAGGLKEIELLFGVKRSDLVRRIANGDPLLLWRMYRASGDTHYLHLLIEYNEEDTINLKKITDYCYARLSADLLKSLT